MDWYLMDVVGQIADRVGEGRRPPRGLRGRFLAHGRLAAILAGR